MGTSFACLASSTTTKDFFFRKYLKIEKMAAKKPETTEGGEAPVKRGRGRPKGSTKSKGRGRPKGGVAISSLCFSSVWLEGRLKVQGRAPVKFSPTSGPSILFLYWWSVFLMCWASQFLAQLISSQPTGTCWSSSTTQKR